ncbi:solute carrier organic anion transporter family member 2B1 isoform X7 [Rattus norvegicus]|uniref:solute carrier organic anion transporter family member 2B1 isoform X7 n=1 Tax=Rattus norvegicus TaxID=10116 RepID=UPI002FD862F4
MGPRIGEGPQMPDRSTKATMGAEDIHERKVSMEPRDSHQDAQPRGMFQNIKFFVLCHSILQLAQLMISGYLKSSISTVEKRFGLSSQTSGLLAAFNEVGNISLILFVSYFGSRVHRPRMIGCGAILVAVAGLLMALPHFISEPYRYDHSSPDRSQDFEASLCLPTTMAPASALSNDSCSSRTETKHLTMVGIMFTAQTLLGIGGVPIQPFGISYIDDFAHHSNSPLYLGILFAITMMGPGLAYGLGSLMLRLYVDIDRMPEGGINLTTKDPRWVGAWWLGFLISAGLVVLAASPYFFFPREMPKEKYELHFRQKVLAGGASIGSKVFYTNCSCVAGNGTISAGSCESACSRLVLPFILLISLGAAVASITHTPSFMLILRGVKKEDKTLAVGMQFMLLRVLAWMPSPVIHGSAIDTTCVHWALTCGRRAVCRYYDHDLLRNRFIGLQFFFKSGSLVCFALVLAILRQQSREASTKATVKSSDLQEL